MPRIFWIIVGLATVLAIFVVLFLVVRGYQDGLRQSEAQRRQQIAIQLQSAQDALDEGNPEAALDAYRQVLLLDPRNPDADAGIRNLLRGVGAEPTHTPTAAPPTATPTPEDPLHTVWGSAQALYNAGRWQETIDRLLQVQATDPTFAQSQVEEMLYTAYVSLGTEKSNAGSLEELEEAVYLFDKALELRPDVVATRSMRDTTAQYVDARTYWYADWTKVIELLEDIYRRNPGYRDVRQRLQEAHLEYAETLARQGNWCTAADQYGAAIAVQNAPGLAGKQSEFRKLCDQSPNGTADENGTTTDPIDAATVDGVASSPATATGSLGTGRILYSSQDPVDGRYRIYAQPVTASVRPVVLVEDAIQPDLGHDGQFLAFRSMRGDQRGLGRYDVENDWRMRFTVFSEDSLPSWNPAGNRLVFASDREGDRFWRIYTAWADGNDNGTGLTFGSDPDWHPQEDRIVYRGCDERGNGCGLWTMTGSGSDPAPLTSVPGDARPVWSSDGRSVVFMSPERDGNWEVYRVDVETGAVLRLTDDPGTDGLPTVSPDGSRVAFLSNRDGAWRIWVKPITGGAEQPLAPITGELPDWLTTKLQWVP